MGVNIGNKALKDAYIGDKPIKKIYLGDKLLWQKYDVEIEYLQSTGTQWIDTGILSKNTIGWKIEFMTNLNATSGKNHQYIGATYLINGVRINTYLVDYNNNIRVGWGTGEKNFSTNAFTKRCIKINYFNDRKTYIDDVFKHNLEDIDDSNLKLGLFCGNSKGLGKAIPQGNIYSCQITDGETLVRDYIPVRVGQVGYMYDKVSGQLFGNSGTGNFILGNDI